MKKYFLILLINLILYMPVFASTNRDSAEYLKNKKHLAIVNPFAERAVEKFIEKTLKKNIKSGRYKVKFKAYTLSSLKKGIFKYIEIAGENLNIEEIPVPYLKVTSNTDYNWIDFRKDPIQINSDIICDYYIELNEKTINSALDKKNYQKNLQKVNNIAYPLFVMHDVRIRIKHNKVHVIMDYSIPLSSNNKKRTFMVTTNFKVDNGKIKASNIGIDNSYGNLPIEKVANLINLLDPLTFTLAQLNEQKCKSKIENVKIEDNIVKINGKIFIEKDKNNK